MTSVSNPPTPFQVGKTYDSRDGSRLLVVYIFDDPFNAYPVVAVNEASGVVHTYPSGGCNISKDSAQPWDLIPPLVFTKGHIYLDTKGVRWFAYNDQQAINTYGATRSFNLGGRPLSLSPNPQFNPTLVEELSSWS